MLYTLVSNIRSSTFGKGLFLKFFKYASGRALTAASQGVANMKELVSDKELSVSLRRLHERKICQDLINLQLSLPIVNILPEIFSELTHIPHKICESGNRKTP